MADPESILKDVRQKYLSFESYSDVGTVEIVPSVGEQSLEFKTYFVRPARFRFEWHDAHFVWKYACPLFASPTTMLGGRMRPGSRLDMPKF